MAHGSRHYDILAPRSKFYQGPYGRLCPELPAWSPPGVKPEDVDKHFEDYARGSMVEVPNKVPREIAEDATLRNQLEKKFSSKIPAGYTYFGQFVDHDITFDPASSLVRQNDPNGLLNFRTPRLDLDNVYGRGPDDQPYLYDAKDKAKMLIGKIPGATKLRDLPRNSQGSAMVGDMRNDENSMVSQIQLGFLLAPTPWSTGPARPARTTRSRRPGQPCAGFTSTSSGTISSNGSPMTKFINAPLNWKKDVAAARNGTAVWTTFSAGNTSPISRWSSRSRPIVLGTRWCATVIRQTFRTGGLATLRRFSTIRSPAETRTICVVSGR